MELCTSRFPSLALGQLVIKQEKSHRVCLLDNVGLNEMTDTNLSGAWWVDSCPPFLPTSMSFLELP